MQRKSLQVLFVAGCVALGGAAATWLLPRLAPQAAAQPPADTHRASPTDDLQRLSDRFEAVFRKCGPTVVSVDARKPSPPTKTGKGQVIEESGSGVLVRLPGQRDVFVLTNNHVVQDAASDQISITLADGRIFQPDRVWADPESDIAVLRLKDSSGVATASLGDSDRVRVGQWVVAIGSPFGLSQTLTHGIISARERGQVSLGSTIRIKDFLQTDAAINPGSSGGPLFNLEGEIIGINTAIASHSNTNSGVAFSIPINLVKRVVQELMERGSVARGYLGLQLASSFEASDALRLGLTRVQGAIIEEVYPATPAATAGLRANDVILEVDGVPIRNENHLINLISQFRPGQKVQLKVWREKRASTVSAVVGDWSRGQEKLRREP